MELFRMLPYLKSKTSFIKYHPFLPPSPKLVSETGNGIEDELWWNTAFDERGPLMEDDLWWKKNFDGRRPSMEDDL